MNILILNWRDPKHPLAGGAEISLYEHAKYWQQKGASITWFASHFPGVSKNEIQNEITVIRAGSHFTTVLYAFYYYLMGKFGRQDLVIDCFHFIPFFTPLYMRGVKRIALINEVAGKVWFSNLPWVLAWVGYLTEPYFFRFYTKTPFITASESTKDDLLKVGIKEQNITIIHHGVSTKTVKESLQKEKVPTLLFLNRISIDKGIEDVLDVFLSIKKHVPNVQLWIVGKEETGGLLSILCTKRGINLRTEKRIKTFGYVSQKRKFELLKKSWILIHPSKKEGWGLTVIEAASQRTPTIGYNVEGLRDSIKNNKTGLLVTENPQAIVDAIFRLLQSKKRFEQMSSNAYHWSTQFNWVKSAQLSWTYLKRAMQSTQ